MLTSDKYINLCLGCAIVIIVFSLILRLIDVITGIIRNKIDKYKAESEGK